jgi:8-oxo-dGTP diphosphatase
VREWLVAGGLVEGPEGILLVQNRRRDGSLDWSPPGGVVEVSRGESLRSGLTREVEEETGIRVSEWKGPVYLVEAVAPDLGWRMSVEVHRAVAYSGEIEVGDPDGIVVAARFVPAEAWGQHLSACHPWVREPLGAWLEERWDAVRTYQYRVDENRNVVRL